MQTIPLLTLLKVTAKSMSPYVLMGSSLFLRGLLFKSTMEQVLVGCKNDSLL